MATHVLIVEDEADIASVLEFHLKREGYSVSVCRDGAEAEALLRNHAYDLVLLDWQLPGKSGIQLCKEWSAKHSIVMLTARDHAADIVLGLESGAFDYVTKPFEIPVLLARIRSVLRRSNTNLIAEVGNPGGLLLNEDRFEATLDGNQLQLTPNEFKLLGVLLQHRGKVLTRQNIIAKTQGQGWAVTPRSIDTAIYELRKKLGTAGTLIETVRGVGYRIESQ